MAEGCKNHTTNMPVAMYAFLLYSAACLVNGSRTGAAVRSVSCCSAAVPWELCPEPWQALGNARSSLFLLSLKASWFVKSAYLNNFGKGY